VSPATTISESTLLCVLFAQTSPTKSAFLLTDQEFQKRAIEGSASKPVLVDFFAE
jgi:thioredoxin-like negative regulator of GroEL